MIRFDGSLEYVASNWLKYNKIRLWLEDNNIRTFGEFVKIDHEVVNLMGYYRFKVFEILQYIKYIKNNGDYDLAENPTPGDNKNFRNWQIQRWKRVRKDLRAPAPEIVANKEVISNSNVDPADNNEIINAKFESSTVPVPVPVPITTTTTTTPVIHREIVSNAISNILVILNNSQEEETNPKDASSNLNITNDYEYSKEDVGSNLIVVATDEDEFDNAKF